MPPIAVDTNVLIYYLVGCPHNPDLSNRARQLIDEQAGLVFVSDIVLTELVRNLRTMFITFHKGSDQAKKRIRSEIAVMVQALLSSSTFIFQNYETLFLALEDFKFETITPPSSLKKAPGFVDCMIARIVQAEQNQVVREWSRLSEDTLPEKVYLYSNDAGMQLLENTKAL